MTKHEKIKLFREIFKGREDVVPKYWKSDKTGRSGYTPICRNEWSRPQCQKGIARNACQICRNKEYVALSDALIYEHFKGTHILGVYPLLEDNTCHFIAADFDNHDSHALEEEKSPIDDVTAFYEVCQIQEIPCYIFRSKSGNGYHAFIFFDDPVPASKARSVCFAMLQEADVIGDDTELSSFDRLFPNQDTLSGRGIGNLIALPFQGNAAKKGHTLFLNPDTRFRESYKNQWEILAEVAKNTESVLDNLIAEWRIVQQLPDKSNYYRPRQPDYLKYVAFPLADFSRIAEKCRFIAHCRDDATILPEPDWYILLTISSRCRDGKELSHKLSSPYPDYTREETEAKIVQALCSTGPYRCQTIKRINGKYCRTCKYDGRINSPITLGWIKEISDQNVETPRPCYGNPKSEIYTERSRSIRNPKHESFGSALVCEDFQSFGNFRSLYGFGNGFDTENVIGKDCQRVKQWHTLKNIG